MVIAPACECDAPLGLIVACTKSKHAAVPSDLHLGSLDRGPLPAVLAQWLRRVDRAETLHEAFTLYAGPAWASVRRARAEAEQRWGDAPVAILSAGLGLVSASERVPAYSATFAAGEDAVGQVVAGAASRRDGNRGWLQGLQEARAETWERAVRPVAAARLVLVAGGADYLEAAAEQLCALAAGRPPGTLAIISAAGAQRLPAPLRPLRLPAGQEWEDHLGGTRSALNFRLLHWAVKQLGAMAEPDLGHLRLLTADQTARLAGQAPAQRPRTPISRTDEEVMAWIQARLRENAGLSKSQLLHAFRQEASCEQGRFGRLLAAVRGTRQ